VPVDGVSSAAEARRPGGETRTLVLDAAERLFSMHGYRGTSLEEIGRTAGLSRGTPGYLFGSKQRLYRAVMERALGRAKEALEPAYERFRTNRGPVEDAVADVVDAHLNLLAREPCLVRLLHWEALNGGLLLSELAPNPPDLVAFVRQFSTENGGEALDKTDASTLLMSVVALCWVPLAFAEPIARTLGIDPTSSAAREAQRRHIVDFVLARAGVMPLAKD